MANTFLSPLGDYSAVADFCGVKSMPPPAGFERAVDAAARAVRSKCGPVLSESSLSHTTRAATYAVVLPFRAAALASVTSSTGVALTLTDYYIDGQVVRRVDGGSIPACTLTYSSGWDYDAIPAELVGAGYEIARQYWRSQLGNQRGGDEQQGRSWSVGVLADRYIPADWLLAPLGFA